MPEPPPRSLQWSRDEDFIGLGERLGPVCAVVGDAADVVTAQLDLASLEPTRESMFLTSD
jgi:hypothetical protein